VYADLAAAQWDDVTTGRIVAPDGTPWVRHSTRAKRSACDLLIEQGAPLVLYSFAEGRLDWFDGAEARDRWPSVRDRVTGSPRRRGIQEWTAGRWRNPAGADLVFLTGHC
jgi:hypothetical protein